MRRLLACLLLACCGSATAAVAGADGPSVWVLERGDQRVYVAGSVHLLRPGQLPAAGPLARAYADAERLLMEVDLDDLDPAATTATTLALAVDPAGRGLRELLGTDAAAIEAAARAAGFDLAALDRYEPWFVALAATMADLTRAGLDPESGVERELAARAQRDGKPIDGIETLAEQLGLLDELPAAQQARFLAMALEELARPGTEADALVAAWLAGDDRRLAALLEQEFDGFPDLRERLVWARNRRMAAAVAALDPAGGDVLVVVGALHLVGAQGVPALLERQGLRLRRLR